MNPSKEELIDILTYAIDRAIRKSTISTYDDLQGIITECMETFTITDAVLTEEEENEMRLSDD